MLRALEIRDMVIIDRLDLAFQPGLNVLTGETGAGKSILLDALGFVLGWRGRAEVVRQGADRAEVTALFDLPAGHPARAILTEAGWDDTDELILRRTASPDGRKQAWVNDRRAGAEVLRALADHLIELHGQQDDRGLLDVKMHRQLLDQFAVAEPLLAEVRAAWTDLRRLSQRAASLAAERAALAAEEDFLRHAVAELQKLEPQTGEEQELDTARRLMQAAARIGDDISRARQAISSDGAEGLVANAIRWLDDAAGQAEGRLDSALDALARALDALGEAEQGIETCLDALSFDPMRLEQIEERLFAIRALARKHNVLADELPVLAETLAGRLNDLDSAEAQDAELAAALSTAQKAYDAAATRLTALRQREGARLATMIEAELAPLRMERARFFVEIAPASRGPDGMDEVTFIAATNPGAPAGPLSKVASGGELSRFLLALKVCLTKDQTGLTMIFDEIDRGVGGGTADAVGRRLRALAEGGQVLVVTHSPQVAALGAHHWRVEKHVTDGVTTSRVVPLDEDARVEEIARMLSREPVSEAMRIAARELMAAGR
ncbi:DNA repair protein RecN [Ketogulonicigenium vulgare Y25]|uniref:DNA repair protein RecN n=1 Tax=Ketogulonicigenium vulgare (strain WSH-001) TaxID=759362 RepID=F9Y9A0_KETVW|nr:DNA repair protein RecN [Ketogulonicigenium vulgare]ADO41556.1 DNA repair protein RecN [Ketogulonicigenium vulgare Y25]AEM41317.1 DNA repair protein RecN [Ketogulonicigenium vulgare WSH-001]ALJ81454.1 DNA repair protein RecN [Ketogulonicigenium vulgare]AOZ55053.1 DNA repair protein RecN [Ketogulonicigenium vulgare]